MTFDGEVECQTEMATYVLFTVDTHRHRRHFNHSIEDSFTLKQELDKLVLPSNASIISFDTISMYTNININDSLKCISTFLPGTWDYYDCKVVKEAMEIAIKITA